MQKDSEISRMFRYAGNRHWLTILGMILAGISTVLSMVPFVCIWFVVRDMVKALGTGDIHLASGSTAYAWGAVGFSILSILLYFAALCCSHLAAFRTATNMKKAARHHIVTLPLGYFSQNASGRLRKVIDDNAGMTENFLAHQLPDLTGAVVMPVAVIVLLFVFDWRLGLCCLVPLALSVYFLKQMMGGDNAHFMDGYMKALETMNKEAVEYIRGIPVVKVFQQTVYSFKNFHAAIEEYETYASGYALKCRIPLTGFNVALNGTFILLIPAKSAVNRIEEVLNEQPLTEAKEPKQSEDASVAFEHVSFAYDGAKNKALDDISFEIPAGKTVALVGASGSGKSTAAKLLPRFYDVTGGRVLLGGVDVRDVDKRALMHQIAFVFQNTKLFKDTLFENIHASRPEASREEVLAAVQAAQCQEIIDRLPQGLDTMVGAGGTYLSGGENQRIALARAILKDAPVIVLDEATAFADAENEHQIQLAFEKLTQNKTVLMIAHRLSTIQNADLILVFNEGKIIERGTHDTLLKKHGTYASMWQEYQTSIAWKVGKEAK